MVLDMSPEMWTETMAVAPAAAAASYFSRKAAGAGREVETGTKVRRAEATAAASMSTPSACSVPPMTTCRGTTPTSNPSSRSAGR